MSDLDPVTAAPFELEIHQPLFDCIRHPDTYVVTFSGDPTTYICGKCWRDWCLAQGWEAKMREAK